MHPLQEKMECLVREGVVPGMALRVRRHGEVAFEGCAGWADIENRVPVRFDTIYRMCSMTKLVTAVAVMRLVERGALSLDDGIRKFFPNYPESKAAITVRHLLNHCCGMGQSMVGNRYISACLAPGDTQADWIEKWGDMPLDCAIGTSAHYSGQAAFDLAGRIVELVSGQALGAFIQEHIAGPLGMKDTGFTVPGDRLPRMAKLYDGASGKLTPAEDIELFQRPDFELGCGGLYSTLDDYDRFTTMLYGGGALDGVRILSEDTLWLMRTPEQITADSLRPGQRWGLGFLVFEHPEWTNRRLGHFTFGWSGAYGTHMYIDPENDLCVTLMAARKDIGGEDSVASFAMEEAIFDQYCE